jgi:hypothetical protein
MPLQKLINGSHRTLFADTMQPCAGVCVVYGAMRSRNAQSHSKTTEPIVDQFTRRGIIGATAAGLVCHSPPQSTRNLLQQPPHMSPTRQRRPLTIDPRTSLLDAPFWWTGTTAFSIRPEPRELANCPWWALPPRWQMPFIMSQGFAYATCRRYPPSTGPIPGRNAQSVIERDIDWAGLTA